MVDAVKTVVEAPQPITPLLTVAVGGVLLPSITIVSDLTQETPPCDRLDTST